MSSQRIGLFFGFVLMLLLMLATGCSSSANIESPDGDEKAGGFGEPCFSDGSCNGTLVCISDICQYALPDGDPELVEIIQEEDPDYECVNDNQCSPGYWCRDHVCELRPVDGDLDEEVAPELEPEEEGELEIPDGPKLEVSPDPLNFGSVVQGESSTRELELASVGEEDLRIIDMTIEVGQSDAGVFVFTAPVDPPFTISMGTSVHVSLRFTRSGEGEAQARLKIESNDVLKPVRTLYLIAEDNGRVQFAVDPAMMEFGLAPVGERTSSNLSLRNLEEGDGAGTVIVSDVQIISESNTFFLGSAASIPPFTIEPGGTLQLPLDALPNQAGEENGTLLLYHNDPTIAYPLEVALHVIGTVPELSLNTSVLDFASIPVGDRREMQATLRNNGGLTLTVQEGEFGPGSSPVFSYVESPDISFPFDIEPGQTQTLTFAFEPQAIGEVAATYKIYSNSYDASVSTLTLTGQGIPPALSITPGLLDYQCVQVGSTLSLPVTIDYQGEGEIIIDTAFVQQSQVFSLPTPPAFPVTLHQGESLQLDVQYAPNVEIAEETASLTIALGTEPVIYYMVDLKGCGISSLIDVDLDYYGFDDRVQKLPKPMGEMTETERELWVAKNRVTVSSVGGAPLHISSIQPETGDEAVWGIDLDEEDFPITVQPGESMSFDILWGPTEKVVNHGKIILCNDGVNALGSSEACETEGHHAYEISLNAEPIELELIVTPDELDFTQIAGDEISVIVVNQRPYQLNIESIEILGTDDFEILNVTPEAGEDGWTLYGVSGEYMQIDVRFNPQGDVQNGALVLRHNDKDAARLGAEPGDDYPEFNVLLSGVYSPNHPPEAVIQSPAGDPNDGATHQRVVAIDQVVELSGAASTDPDTGDTVESFQWSIDQTSGYVWGAAGLNQVATSITFRQSGQYTVRLQVTDTQNAQSLPSSDSRLEIAVQGDPIAIATELGTGLTSVTAQAKIPLRLDGTQSTDPDGEIVAYRWYLREHPDGELSPLSNDPQPSHTFNTPGYYDVLLEVEDNDGRVSADRAEIQVHAIANDSIRVELVWTGSGDVDLHYLRPSGTLESSGDCHEGNENPDWGDWGTPQFTHSSDDGLTPEAFRHDNPDDGIYNIVAEYVSHWETCYTENDCRWYDDNCDLCGCTCPPFCYALRICCGSCEHCVPVEHCDPVSANLTFRIYLNDSPTPTWMLTGDAYKINASPGTMQFSLMREDGAFRYVAPED